jgi:hypothetical protein
MTPYQQAYYDLAKLNVALNVEKLKVDITPEQFMNLLAFELERVRGEMHRLA